MMNRRLVLVGLGLLRSDEETLRNLSTYATFHQSRVSGSLIGSSMLEKVICAFFIVGVPSFSILAQGTKPVHRDDSVVVSASVSKEQLALEDRLNELISQGDQALKSGNAAEAIRQYESARDLVQKEPLLAEQKDRTMKKLGAGYFGGNRMKEAIQVFSDRLDARKKDCESESTAVSDCADAESDLCAARMYDNDFVTALACFQDVEAKYSKARGYSHFHEFTMIETMKEAETKASISLMLYQLGRTPEAIAAAEAAVPLLSTVKDDEAIQRGIRDEATSYLEATKTLLTRFTAN